MRLAIDASRIRTGGGAAHIAGILAESSPPDYGIKELHLFATPTVQARISDRAWLVKHTPKPLLRSLPFQLMWQATQLPAALNLIGCDLLLTVDASTLCRWSPSVVMSRDMLSYEPGIRQLFGFTRRRARIEAIKLVQNRAMRRAAGVVFLTRYQAQVIQNSCGPLQNIAIIPHGVDPSFHSLNYDDRLGTRESCKVRCTYVSQIELYKNQWVVIDAIDSLRKDGLDVTLTLIGGGKGPAMARTVAAIRKSNGGENFVSMVKWISHDVLLRHLEATDIYVFASSCESISVTLLEGMAAGLPITCSNKGPMPEVLQQNGVYFDPHCANSIAAAIRRLIEDPALRLHLAASAKRAAEEYTWARCGTQLWEFLAQTHTAAQAYPATVNLSR